MTILLPLLSMAAVASCQPHGYQYQLPIEYNSYSQHDGNSYSQLKPFRRFLQKYMASSKSKENQPSIQLRYMSHPMANVPVSDIHQYMDRQNTDWDQYMVGEYFFKDHDEDHHHFHEEDGDGSDGDEDQLPYTVVEEYETYEKRLYPSALYVCNTTHVDTAGDPLAGLERMNPFEVMMSRRYQKTPRSQQFMELFRYIQGVNQNQEEIAMTRPVVVFHNVTKETTLGNYEKQVMCFYLPQKYQEHDHPEDKQETKPAPRHAPATPPQPMDNGRVFLLTRPSMEVFVRRFGGFALTHDTWEKQREILEEDILGQKYNPSEYFTATYKYKRNEVWIQSHQPFQTLPAKVDAVNPIWTSYQLTRSTSRCDRDNWNGKINYEIVDLINKYRRGKGFKELECHWALVRTATLHTRNQNDSPPPGPYEYEDCNLHSWLSSTNLGREGKQCCYPSDHTNQKCMWNKPQELSKTTLKGNGLEISAGSRGWEATAKGAFDIWKNSAGHNVVMAGWSGLKRVGCFYEGGFANCWFV